MTEEPVEIYTDGSCHTQHKIGTWAAILFSGKEKKILAGIEKDTTHNRMELTAVIKAIEYARTHYKKVCIRVFTDSQYVTVLPARKEKLVSTDFITGKGAALQNADLIKIFFIAISVLDIAFIKIKAHQKKDDTINYNREADMLSRKLLRAGIEDLAI
ncbi:MAG: RNase H family protein [Chitinophagaceae bacterium]